MKTKIKIGETEKIVDQILERFAVEAGLILGSGTSRSVEKILIEILGTRPELEAEEARDGWIEIKSEADLPKYEGWFLVTLVSGYPKIRIDLFEDNIWNINRNDVVAWQPLPEPSA